MASRTNVFFSTLLALVLLVDFVSDRQPGATSADDLFFQQIVRENAFPNDVLFFYTGQNGRLAAHVLCCTFYRAGNAWPVVYAVWPFLLLAAFVAAVWRLLRALCVAGVLHAVSGLYLWLLTMFVVNTYYTLFAPTNAEVWHWVAASCVHTVSLVLLVWAAAVLVRHRATRKPIRLLAVFGLFFSAGGFSETNLLLALAGLVVLLLAHIGQRRRISFALLAAIGGLVAALVVHGVSAGAAQRLGWLPAFDVVQAVKNTAHSFWRLVPDRENWFAVLCGVGFGIVLVVLLQALLNLSRKQAAQWAVGFASVAVLGVFATCFLLSDVAPLRAMSLVNVCLLVAALLAFHAFRKPRTTGY